MQPAVVEPLDLRASAAWSRADPAVSVVLATHKRAGYLPELLAALESLCPPAGGFEVVVADDGSDDATWDTLLRWVAGTELAALALRLPASGGPSVPRNTAIAKARGALLALTDDDCLPEPQWLVSLVAALGCGVGIVQGRTRAVEAPGHGPWDRTIGVEPLSGLWETCNLGIRAELFEGLGGFRTLAVRGSAPRGFGEDVLLGARAARVAGSAPAPDAVVRHRWLPSSYRDHLAGRRRVRGFPLLVREVPEVRDRLWLRVFLTRRTAMTWAGVLGLGTALATRRALPALAAGPLLLTGVRDASHRPGRPLPWRVAQVLVGDAVATASLVEGSIRHRRLVL